MSDMAEFNAGQLYDAEPPDCYVPTLGDVAAAVGLVLGALTFVAYRRWRWAR